MKVIDCYHKNRLRNTQSDQSVNSSRDTARELQMMGGNTAAPVDVTGATVRESGETTKPMTVRSLANKPANNNAVSDSVA